MSTALAIRLTVAAFAGAWLSALITMAAAADEPPLRIEPSAARQHVGMRVEVVFEVRAAKHSVRRKTVFLDSEKTFQDEANLGNALLEEAVAALRQKGVNDPVEDCRGRRIRVVGVVVIEEDRPYIRVNAADQFEIVRDDDNA